MNTDDVFFALLRAGLWGKTDCESFSGVDWNAVYGLASEQTVSGLLADGISVMKHKDPSMVLPADVQNRFMRAVMGGEMRNRQMNATLSHICKVLSEKKIKAVLLKGQGVALDYLQPMRRMPGDIDFLLDDDGYAAARSLLGPKAGKLEQEDVGRKHLGMWFGDVELELHGTLKVGFGKEVDRIMENLRKDLFARNDFRVWNLGGADVLLPSPDFDAVFIFMHFIQHFYHGGIGLRQICDWIMHLHKFSGELDLSLLEHRLDVLKMENEWHVFGWMAVNLLGLPEKEMPFYDRSCGPLATKVWNSMVMAGNFGKKLSAGRNLSEEKYIWRKTKSFFGHVMWLSRHMEVSAHNTFRAFMFMLSSGLSSTAKGD